MLLDQKTNRLLALCLLFVGFAFLTSCKKDPDPVATNSITDIVSKNNDFTLLRAALVRANLTETFKTGTFTVFAPNDAAFKASGIADVAAVNNLPVATLTNILQYHVLGKRVAASEVPTAVNTPLQTLLTTNGTVYVSKIGSTVSINGKKVITPDVAADNGVIHVIDGVLMPPSGDIVATVLANPGSYSLLAQAVTRAGTAVVTALQSTTAATVFAPTNEAFIAAGFNAAAIAAAAPATLAKVLSYHVVPGRVFSSQLTDGLTVGTLLGATPTLKFGVGTGVTVLGASNGTSASNVVVANEVATNAVIHRIDRVLLP
ncbi:fasciclin domain-containing protein [Fibrella aquatilis]|uniref:Fasciclin domain-containing protein n=1 Tax=Fibrella aquatilis TaxID=2817059 RepID=A0A939G8I3_9BACT|nr:fasciclin domain-containing protein [Fibrella aquatilis]MBO0934174.1 fasciclin domain-containing protein [Fibrella aquatilis]